MTAQSLISIVIPFITILFLLLVGAGMRRWRLVTPEGARQMTGLVLNVALPALIFVTLATEVTAQELSQAPLLAAMGVVGTLLGYAVAAAIARLPLVGAERRTTFLTAVAVVNTAFIGYPLCEALLGSRGLLYAVLYDVGLTAVMSSFSIWVLSSGSRDKPGRDDRSDRSGGAWRALLRSPMMWSLIAGVVWGALRWPTPEWLLRPLRTLGQVTTPLALLTVGMLIQPAQIGLGAPGSSSYGSLGRRSTGLRWQLALLSVARLIVAPALMWALVSWLKVERTVAAVIVLQAAVPSAVVSTAMAEQYGGDSAFAAAGVVTTTVLSLLTLPVWSWIMLRG